MGDLDPKQFSIQKHFNIAHAKGTIDTQKNALVIFSKVS